MNELIEKYAIMMAGCSADIWAKYYPDTSKEFWRKKAEEMIKDVMQDWSRSGIHC